MTRRGAVESGSTVPDADLARITETFQRTKDNHVADFLRERIAWGYFPRGHKLKQAELAEMLRISITPVREALKLLEAEGYVVGTSHKGAVVAPFQIERAGELRALRVVLEGRLTKAALDRITPAQVAQLEALQAATAEAAGREDTMAARRANYKFHFLLYGLADQPQTLHFVRVLWARYPFDLMARLPDRLAHVKAEHDDFLAAIRAGDKRAAVRAMRTHIEAGWREFVEHYPRLEGPG